MKMFKCLNMFIYMTIITIVFCAPGYIHREKQKRHEDLLSHFKTAVRKQRDTRNLEFEADIVKVYEITDLKDKEVFAISPLNDRTTQDQKLKIDINTLLSFLNSSNFTEQCNQYNCIADGMPDSNSNSEDRTLKNGKNYNYEEYYNSNQFYEDKIQSSLKDRGLSPPSYYDYWNPSSPPRHHHRGLPPAAHHGEPLPPPPHHGGPPPPPQPHHGGPPPPPPYHREPPSPPPPPPHGIPPPPLPSYQEGPPSPHYDYYNYEQSSKGFHQPPGPPHHDVRSRRRDPPPPSEYNDAPRPPPHDNPYPPPPPPHGYKEPPPPPPPNYKHPPSSYDYRDRPPHSFHGRLPPPTYRRSPPISPYEKRPPPPPNHHTLSYSPNAYYGQQENIGYRSSYQESYDETKRTSDEERQTRQSSSNDSFGENNRSPLPPLEPDNNFDGDISEREIVEPIKMENPLANSQKEEINDSGYMLDAIFGENISNQYNARYKEYSDEETTSLSPFFFQVAAVTPDEG